MIIHVFNDKQELSRVAAGMLSAQAMVKPDSVFGLATGSTPVLTYQILTEMVEKGEASFKQATSFNLDEYLGLAHDHPASYHHFMQENLFQKVPFKANHLPDGMADNGQAECLRYDNAIVAHGGIDLQVLGIGHNGHIGFNEPSDVFHYGTQLVQLTESTIKANQRFFDSIDDVPRQAISLGIGGIMAAKRVMLMAYGRDKADAISRMVRGEITPWLPASILRLHPDCVVLLDRDAASGLHTA